ncbi:MAG: stage II sporulation protein M [Chloroflexaceae bacterium]|nr:stage II sporulation protein M [Chloroflexaceae bacterium]
MLAEEFINLKRPAWERLTHLIGHARLGLTGLSAEELQELGRLYRQATSDLAVARRDYPTHLVSAYLNGLVAEAHGYIYREKSTRWQDVGRFFTHTFPQAFRATWGYTLAAFLMFIIPALIGFGLGWRDPDAVTLVMPELQGVIADIQSETEWWLRINEDGRSSSAAFIMTNNIRVAFLAFAGGVTLGILTLYVLMLNGFMLGGIAGVAQRFDFADNLWGFVMAHGVVELSVIFIAGGAGLQLGWAIVRPGWHTRRAALVLAARRAVVLLVGCVPLLIGAGIIEGFISPAQGLPLAVKGLVAFTSGVAMYAYLLRSGRD